MANTRSSVEKKKGGKKQPAKSIKASPESLLLEYMDLNERRNAEFKKAIASFEARITALENGTPARAAVSHPQLRAQQLLDQLTDPLNSQARDDLDPILLALNALKSALDLVSSGVASEACHNLLTGLVPFARQMVDTVVNMATSEAAKAAFMAALATLEERLDREGA
jgi:phage baseplate assembly protein W